MFDIGLFFLLLLLSLLSLLTLNGTAMVTTTT
jgi:hypothetical protein